MIIGLTGGICAGKSTAVSFLRYCGVHVIDVDEIVNYLYTYNPQIISSIVGILGGDVLTPHGILSRPAMRRIIFSNEQRRKEVEKCLAPKVNSIVSTIVYDSEMNQKHLVITSALLLERTQSYSLNETWSISTPEKIRKIRLLQRLVRYHREAAASDGRPLSLNVSELHTTVNSILASQMTDEERDSKADKVFSLQEGDQKNVLWKMLRVAWEDATGEPLRRSTNENPSYT